MFINPPLDTTYFHHVFGDQTKPVQRSLLLNDHWESILCLLYGRSHAVNMAEKRWRKIQKWLSVTSCAYTWFSGIVYVIARLTILVLAFAALRQQDERVYLDTWARLLPI